MVHLVVKIWQFFKRKFSRRVKIEWVQYAECCRDSVTQSTGTIAINPSQTVHFLTNFIARLLFIARQTWVVMRNITRPYGKTGRKRVNGSDFYNWTIICRLTRLYVERRDRIHTGAAAGKYHIILIVTRGPLNIGFYSPPRRSCRGVTPRTADRARVTCRFSRAPPPAPPP